MRHFVYAMNGKDPAPAAGGDTKSWFFFYKWDVGGLAFVPLAPAQEVELPTAGDLLWFVMDQNPLGYVPVEEVIAIDGGGHELHYDTRKIIGPGESLQQYNCTAATGMAHEAMADFFSKLRGQFFKAFPARLGGDPPPSPRGERS